MQAAAGLCFGNPANLLSGNSTRRLKSKRVGKVSTMASNNAGRPARQRKPSQAREIVMIPLSPSTTGVSTPATPPASRPPPRSQNSAPKKLPPPVVPASFVPLPNASFRPGLNGLSSPGLTGANSMGPGATPGGVMPNSPPPGALFANTPTTIDLGDAVGLPPNGSSNTSRPSLNRRLPVKSYMPGLRLAAANMLKEMQQQQQTPVAEQQQAAPNGASSTALAPSQTAVLSSMREEDAGLEEVQFDWAEDKYNVWKRNVDTWLFFTTFRTSLWSLEKKWTYVGGAGFTEERKHARTRALARYLLESILQLGPTFIKVGQLSSTRSDLFPAEFIEELAQLQDRVPAFPVSKAVSIIEKDLGASLPRLFKSFNPKPIAAASLGQVHRAVLHSGEQVVVKVQRPGLRQLFDIDLNNLRLLAEFLDKGPSDNEMSDFKEIYEECANVLYQEIDYINEGRNADRFRRNFAPNPRIKAPVVHWQYCSSRVLTLEYLPGVKITDKERLLAAGIDLTSTAKLATDAYLTQILTHGFFHADPHPGNIAVDGNGALLFYDFGMMGQIVPDVRERLLDLFYGVYKRDSNQVLSSLIALKVIKPTSDNLSLKRSINYFLSNLLRQTQEQETITAIGEDLFSIATDQPFRFPATFTFVLRAFSTLEGIGKTLDPDYNFNAVASPYAQELILNSQRTEVALLQQLQDQVSEVSEAAVSMPMRIARINTTIDQLESGDLKLRVRTLESERALKRAGILQVVTLNSVAAVGFLNVGTMLAVSEHFGPATLCMGLSSLFGVLVLNGMRRVGRLDRFEKKLRA